MSDLPASWLECKLGDVVDYGSTRKVEPEEISANVWVLELEDIEKNTSRILQRLTFSERKSKSTKNQFDAGDVLYGKLRPYLNKVVRATEPGVCTTEIIPISPPSGLDAGYFFYWLKHPRFIDYVTSVSHGLNMPRLGTEAGKSAPFILAPFEEQKRIAAVLDSVLTRVDACRERLDRVPGILKRFHRALLTAATSGELTQDWRNENANRLTDWEHLTIGELIEDKPRNGYSPRAVDHPTPVKSLTLTATTQGVFRGEHFKYIDQEIPQNSHLWLVPGDILIQRANTLEYVGVSAIFDGPSETFIYPDLMMKCRANSRVLTQFLYYILSSESTRSYFRKNATGTAGNMPKINQKTVINAPVRLPSLDEQLEIVRRTTEILSFSQKLETHLHKSHLMVEKITAALLAKAFRGELTPQDPSDEPAFELLPHLRDRMSASAVIDRNKHGTRRSRRKSVQREMQMLVRKEVMECHLTAILKEQGAMTAESLWSASQLEIDDFYDQLKDEESRGLLREMVNNATDAPRLLESVL